MDIRDVKEISDSSGFKFLGVNNHELVGVPVEKLINTTNSFKNIESKNKELDDEIQNTKKEISEISNNISSIKKNDDGLILKPFVCDYFTPLMMCGTEETSAQYLSRSNMWVLDNSQIICTGEKLEKNIRIWDMAKKLNPDLKLFYYISIRSVHIDNIPVYSRQEILQKFRDAIHIGAERYTDVLDEEGFYTYEPGEWHRVDGIFFDDVDFDDVSKDGGAAGIIEQGGWETKREKLNDLIDEAHKLDLVVMANDWRFMNSFDTEPTTEDDNYYENPKGLKYNLGEGDYFMMESYTFRSDGAWTPVGDGWRYMDYKTKYYDTGIYKAKGVGMDYMEIPGLSRNEVDIAYSFFIAEAITTGIPYLCILNSDCFVWDVPEILKEMSANRLGEDAYYEKIGKGHFKVTANGHTLETIRALNYTEQYTKRENIDSILACKIFYDGKRIINFFNRPGELEYNVKNKIEEINKNITKIENDKHSNSSMMSQLLIDDDDPGRVLNIYTNILDDYELELLTSIGGVATKEEIDDYSFIVNFNSGWNGCGYAINIDETNKDIFIGKTLEFGVLEYSCDFNLHWSLEITTESNGLEYILFYEINNGKTILEDDVNPNNHLYTSYTIPEDCTKIRFMLVQHTHNVIDQDGSISCSRPYIIDISENDGEIAKKWFTQLYPMGRNVYASVDVECTSKKVNDETTIDMRIETKDPWGWSVYKFSEDELNTMRGHRFELGCSSATMSGDMILGGLYLNNTHVSFGVGIDSEANNMPNPITCAIYGDVLVMSEVYNTEMYCTTFMVPENAESLVVGVQSYGIESGTIINLTDLYLYDLDERKDLSIRGEDPSKTYITMSRVSADRFEIDVNKKRLLANALYIIDDGRCVVTNSNKKVIELSGAIYYGAVNAGYEGTPEQFGRDLYGFMEYLNNNIQK